MTIYSTPTCVYCKATKKLFDEHNVQYSEKDVAVDLEARNEMVHKSGQLGVPVVDIDGQIVIGYNKAKLFELLKIAE